MSASRAATETMCGIAGKVLRDEDRRVSEVLLQAMNASLKHRGPDDEGLVIDGEVGLCMRRLKVVDLEGGGQPMANEDGSILLVFNGEIYNHRELRLQLEDRGHEFRSESDTESIIHLYEEIGIDCVLELRGMFAFALWDRTGQKLIMARDRLGKKPLYYAHGGHGIAFASELQALLKDGDVDRALDFAAIDEYLRYLFVPHPRTPFRAVRKLPPASYAVYSKGELSIQRYWDVEYGETESRSIDEASKSLEALLLESVEMRLQADVPVGAFLSGGLDSSLVTALMCKAAGSGDVRTFSIGFDDSSFDELGYARQVAEQLGTRHEESVVGYEVRDLFPELLDHFGEPYADSSAIPTYHLSRLTRGHVTVALSGDGGDEVFGGYRRYQAGLMAQVYNRWPRALGRDLFERTATLIPEPATYYGDSPRKKLRRFLEFAAAVRDSPETSWAFFLSEGERAGLYSRDFASTLGANGESDSFSQYIGRPAEGGGQAMMKFDLLSYLPDDILTKVDRMSMACSLEVRCPLLDHKVVEFMAQVPQAQKYTFRHSKRLLRRIASRYLPETILRRPKHGFAVPMARWLQTDLLPWAQDLLTSSAFRTRGLFTTDRVEGMLEAHVAGRRDFSQQIWSLMVLELWFQRNLGGVSAAKAS